MKRRLAAVLLAAALVVTLAGCRKPAPQITAYSGTVALQVKPAFYQFSGGPVRQQLRDFGDAPVLKVRDGGTVLIDVPRAVSVAWVVAALTLDSNGKSTPLAGVTPQQVLRDRYSVRLPTRNVTVSEFYVQVAQLRGSTQAGGWVFKVEITA